MQKMADGGQLVEVVEGPGGSLTGTAAATLRQVSPLISVLRLQKTLQCLQGLCDRNIPLCCVFWLNATLCNRYFSTSARSESI